MAPRLGPQHSFPEVALAAGVDDVQVQPAVHNLTRQAERLASLTNRMGHRLSEWLRETSRVAVKTKTIAPLPSAEWIETFRYYQAALLGLLKEQTSRARLAQGLEKISEAELRSQFAAQLEQALQTFTPKQRAHARKVFAELDAREVVDVQPAQAEEGKESK